MKDYIFEYDYDGSRYQIEIPAESQEEAQGRVAAIRSTSRYIGYVVSQGQVGANGWVLTAFFLAIGFGLGWWLK